MHRAFRDARRAGRERDQADVVGGGIHRCERRTVTGHARVQAVRVLEIHDGRAMGHLFEFVRERPGAQHGVHARLGEDDAQLARPQQRHGRHGDEAGLEHGEDRGRHHRTVRAAQQHPVARHEAHVLEQHVGDAVDPVAQLGIGPRQRIAQDGGTRAASGVDMAVQQFRHAVQARRVLQLGQVEHEVRPQVGRREMIPRERVDVGRR